MTSAASTRPIGPCDPGWRTTRSNAISAVRRPTSRPRASARSRSTRRAMCMCCGAASRRCWSSTRTARSSQLRRRARYSIPTAFRSTRWDRVWIADRDAHQVVVFDLAGEPCLRIGERHRPRWRRRSTIRRAPRSRRTAKSMSPTATAMRDPSFSAAGELRASFGEVGQGPANS